MNEFVTACKNVPISICWSLDNEVLMVSSFLLIISKTCSLGNLYFHLILQKDTFPLKYYTDRRMRILDYLFLIILVLDDV